MRPVCYSIGETIEEGERSVSAAPDIWIQNGKLRWPKKFASAKRKKLAMPEDDWDTYDVKILKANIKSLREALEQEKIYSAFSNSESEREELNRKNLKRQHPITSKDLIDGNQLFDKIRREADGKLNLNEGIEKLSDEDRSKKTNCRGTRNIEITENIILDPILPEHLLQSEDNVTLSDPILLQDLTGTEFYDDCSPSIKIANTMAAYTNQKSPDLQNLQPTVSAHNPPSTIVSGQYQSEQNQLKYYLVPCPYNSNDVTTSTMVASQNSLPDLNSYYQGINLPSENEQMKAPSVKQRPDCLINVAGSTMISKKHPYSSFNRTPAHPRMKDCKELKSKRHDTKGKVEGKNKTLVKKNSLHSELAKNGNNKNARSMNKILQMEKAVKQKKQFNFKQNGKLASLQDKKVHFSEADRPTLCSLAGYIKNFVPSPTYNMEPNTTPIDYSPMIYNEVLALKTIIMDEAAKGIEHERKLACIEQSQNEILKKISENETNLLTPDDIEDLDEKFNAQNKIKTAEQLENLEFQMFTEPLFKKRLTLRMARFGGKNAQLMIRACMKYLIEDSVLDEYTWKGKDDKGPFTAFKYINKTVYESVRTVFPKYTEYQFNKYMVEFLKHSTTRIKQARIKQGEEEVEDINNYDEEHNDEYDEVEDVSEDEDNDCE